MQLVQMLPKYTEMTVNYTGLTTDHSTAVTADLAVGDVGNLQGEGFTYTNAQRLTQLNIYAKNYNVLRVMSGMAGLAYSN